MRQNALLSYPLPCTLFSRFIISSLYMSFTTSSYSLFYHFLLQSLVHFFYFFLIQLDIIFPSFYFSFICLIVSSFYHISLVRLFFFYQIFLLHLSSFLFTPFITSPLEGNSKWPPYILMNGGVARGFVRPNW